MIWQRKSLGRQNAGHAVHRSASSVSEHCKGPALLYSLKILCFEMEKRYFTPALSAIHFTKQNWVLFNTSFECGGQTGGRWVPTHTCCKQNQFSRLHRAQHQPPGPREGAALCYGTQTVGQRHPSGHWENLAYILIDSLLSEADGRLQPSSPSCLPSGLPCFHQPLPYLAALTGSHTNKNFQSSAAPPAFSYHKMMFKVQPPPLFGWELVWAAQSSVPALYCTGTQLSCSPPAQSHPQHRPS